VSEGFAAGFRRPALVHDWLTGRRGGEAVLEQVAAELPGAPIYTLFHVPGSVGEALEAHPIHTSPLQRAPRLRRAYRNYLGLFPAAIESFDLRHHDLVLSFSHCVAKGALPAPHAMHLCYCFTPVRYAWDQEAVYFPRRRGLVARLRAQVLSRLRVWDVASLPRVDSFVTLSRFVAERIRRYYGREAEVLHPPVATETFTPGGAGRERYALAVAAAVPYKRLDLAIAACERLGLELRVAGGGPDTDRLRRLADGRTRILGRVPHDDLVDLYRRAACFVQPGVEDFGISSVEALACGTPVVALAAGGVLDIVEDGRHGVLYEGEGEAGALAAAIDKSLQMGFNVSDLRRRAEQFSNSRFRDGFRRLLARLPGAPEGAHR
jgi:glycosyltransferase involved in cell wall biosynthesis